MMRKKRRTYKGKAVRSRRDAQARTKSRLIRLGICLAILAAASILRMIFPAAFEALGAKITEKVDFKSAFSALGEGFSGKTGMKDAVSEAFSYASGGSSDVKEDTSQQPPSDEAIPNAAEPEADDSASGDDGEKQADMAAVMVAAFKQSQDRYEEYAIPEDVTYEYVTIDGQYASPSSAAVTSSFGYRVHPTENTVKFHYGTDFGAAAGDDVYAFADGSVAAVGESTTLGLYMIVEHLGSQTLYAHLESVSVQSGDKVRCGDVIASAGQSGNATSPCLHFELTVDGVYVNPEFYC